MTNNMKKSSFYNIQTETRSGSFRDAVDKLSTLYNQVDEEVHKLVILSNKSQKELESQLEVQKFDEQTQQVTSKSNMNSSYSQKM